MKSSKEMAESILNKSKDYQIKKKQRFRKIQELMIVVLVLSVTGVSIWQFKKIDHNNVQVADLPTKTPIKTQVPVEDGIKIPSIELPKVTEGVAFDMIGLIVYNGKIYTQASYYTFNDVKEFESLKGEYLGRAKGNIDEWSSQDEYSKEFSGTVSGDVYTVNGYDKEFRLCMVEGEFLTFYENLNGITLSDGKSLYEERIKLNSNYEKVLYLTHDEWNYEDPRNYSYKEVEQLTREDMKLFIESLMTSEFVDLSNKSVDIYNQNLNQVHLYFYLQDQTKVEVRLFENGYVSYQPMPGRYFVKMSDNIFEKVFNACQ